jgi:hypothetical protein
VSPPVVFPDGIRGRLGWSRNAEPPEEGMSEKEKAALKA